jgi:hypothetical protein
MRRLASALVAVSMVGGCVNSSPRTEVGGHAASWDRRSVRDVPGVVGAYGERVPAEASAMNIPREGIPLVTGPNGQLMLPNGAKLPPGQWNKPAVRQASTQPGDDGGVQHAVDFGPLSPGLGHRQAMPIQPGMGGPVDGPVAHGGHGHRHGAPMPPPGMGGGPPYGGFDPGAMGMAQAPPRFVAQRTQVRFVRPTGMKVAWFTQTADGRTAYSNAPVDAPGRYNFPQGAIYRLKLSNIEGRPGLEVYPTIEVFPTNPKTESFLAHSSVPVEFTPDDFKQISEGTYVVKVIYLPDPAFQDVASTGTEEILSTRLEPGVDPIQEAIRRGSILAVVRMGNVDQEAPNSPPLNAPAPGGPGPNPLMNFGPLTTPQTPNSMVPFGPTGGGGTGLPPGMMSAPPGLAPQISSAPMPSPRGIVGTPVSRPGMATATPPQSSTPPSTLPIIESPPSIAAPPSISSPPSVTDPSSGPSLK